MKEKYILFIIISIIVIFLISAYAVNSRVFDKGYFSKQRQQTGPVPITIESSIEANKIIEEAVKIRKIILDYLPHPYDYRVRDAERTKLIQARMNILETTMPKYYARGSSLSCYGHEFFDLDMEAIYDLAQIACLTEPRIPTGYEPKTITIEIEGELYTVQDRGEYACNPLLRDLARNAISDLIESERIILIATLKSSPCQVDMKEFQQSMSLAEENIENLRIDKIADNYRSAFIKALRCYCDW